MRDLLGKIRPQVLGAMLMLGAIALCAILVPTEPLVEVSTGCIGGMIALGMKLLESE